MNRYNLLFTLVYVFANVTTIYSMTQTPNLLLNNDKCFFEAIAANNTKKVQEFLESDCTLINRSFILPNINPSYELYPLHLAAAKGHTEMVQLLLAYKADSNVLDSYGHIPFYLAIKYNRYAVVNCFIANRPDLTDTPIAEKSMYAIHVAALHGKLELIKLLVLKAGINVNKCDLQKGQRTPLFYAVAHGHIDIVTWLLDNGANTIISAVSGYTALHTAIAYKRDEIAQLLIVMNYDVDRQDTIELNTPLHLAVLEKNMFSIQQLLQLNADTTIKNKDNLTAFDIALHTKQQPIIDLFINYSSFAPVRI
jgi:ankyrin repeat protein